MDQLAHTWIAVRAVAWLADEGELEGLVGLLKPYVREASVGAWLPDRSDARLSTTRRDNHLFKILPVEFERTRFTKRKQDLLKELGDGRQIYGFLESDHVLPPAWWATPYKGVASPGQHLPNRAMALSTSLRDLLLLGDDKIDALLPGELKLPVCMDRHCRTREEAAAMYFFMVSHFMADAAMPCHCDGRLLARAGGKLHSQLEDYWSRRAGEFFTDENLLGPSSRPSVDSVLEEARRRDAVFDIHFADSIPEMNADHDVWLETVYACRGSFALASVIAPPEEYPYDSGKLVARQKVLGRGNPTLQKEVDRICLHDAVLNTALVWKHIWKKASKTS